MKHIYTFNSIFFLFTCKNEDTAQTDLLASSKAGLSAKQQQSNHTYEEQMQSASSAALTTSTQPNRCAI
jgi:hypothetical protein